MAENLQLRKETGWIIVCTMPDVCKTPPCLPVPYPAVAFLNDSTDVPPKVKANGHPFVLHDKSYVSKTWGDQPGILKGIKNNTVGGECYPIDHSGSFKVNKKHIVRVDDAFWMNGMGGIGNTRGRVFKIPPLSEMINTALDVLQVGLDIVGLIPGFGEIADGINGVISLARGDYVGAALSFGAMIPFAGWAATGAKVATKAVKATKAGSKAAKAASKIGKKAKALGSKIKSKLKIPEKCKPCKSLIGKPVNPMQGSKILMGDMDTDFELNSALPLLWLRSYASNSVTGTKKYPLSWYGQGWDSPYGIQIKVLPLHEKIEVVLPFGRIIEFPYLEPKDHIYSIHEDFTLIRKYVSQDDSNQVFHFQIAVGRIENASVYYEFEHQVKNIVAKPEHLVLCTGMTDRYHHDVGLVYLHKDELYQNYPSHIYDSLNRVLELDFYEIKDQIRLREVRYLQGLDKISPVDEKTGAPLYIQERLFLAQRQADIELEDIEDYLNIKVLARYEYSNQADLIHVYVDDSPVEANAPEQYKLRLSRKFEWNNHIMTAHHEVGGISSYYEYDEYSPNGKVIRHWLNTGEVYLFKYEQGYTDVIHAANTSLEKTERYYFDTYKYLTQYTDAHGHSEYYQYNNKQQLIKKIDADGGITEYKYSGAELLKIRSLIEYDATTKLPNWREINLNWTKGQLTSITDPLGNIETTSYNYCGQPESIIDALGHQTKIEYSRHGFANHVTDAKGGQKHIYWDEFGNLKKYQDCSGKITKYAYDHYDRLTNIENAQGDITQFKYYACQTEPSEIIYPDQSSELFKYDMLGRLIEYRDALGRVTTYQYSHDGLPISRKDAANGVVSYHYDQLRRFVGLTNENGQTWTFEYDANDQVIAETTFDQVRTEYEYSHAGKLIKHRQLTENKTVRYSTIFKRNLLGELLEQYIVDHHALTEKKRTRYQYDLAGQLIEARNEHSHVKLSYDKVGQLSQEQLIAHWFNQETKEHIKRAHVLTHLYDELGNRIETTLPDGRKIKTLYYGSGHAWNYALEDSEGTHEISSLKRDDLHQEIERTQGQLQSTFVLDKMGRLLDQTVRDQHTPDQKKISRAYHYDKAGQLTEILDKRFTSQSQIWQRKQSYQYDVLSRLTASELSSHGQNENYIQIREKFAFDPASNILPIASADSNTRIENNRVKHLDQEHQTVDYEYDDLGRVIQKRIQIKDKNSFGHLSKNHLLNQFSSCQIDLEWDEQNQLIGSISNKPDGLGNKKIIKTQYCYDPFGRRIAKQCQIYQEQLINIQVKEKIDRKAFHQEQLAIQQSSGYNLSLGGFAVKQGEKNPVRPVVMRATKTVQQQQTKFIEKQAVWNVWDGNRILQDYNGKHVFTTVYEADSFVPLARLVWLDEKLEVAANDAITDPLKFDEMQKIALQNIGEAGFDDLEMP